MQQRQFAMRSSTLFAVFVTALAVTAAAEPKQEETSGRVSHTDNADQKNDAPQKPSDWVALATPTPAKHGIEHFVIGKDAGYFSRLRVDAAKGKTIVRKLRVYFDDGKVKNVTVDKAINTRGRSSVEVELGDARAIDRVVVVTETNTGGQYALYGSSGGTGGIVGAR